MAKRTCGACDLAMESEVGDEASITGWSRSYSALETRAGV